MSSMGKAMMGTGEARLNRRHFENRVFCSSNFNEMALNNPLIDEYSLKGAKGLFFYKYNWTKRKSVPDFTLFEWLIKQFKDSREQK